MEPELQLIYIVAGCLIQKDGKYLLVQEKQEKVYGQWNLPAGRVDKGESLEAAAVRETREETGCEVKLGPKISVEHLTADTPVLHAFRAEITGGQLAPPPSEVLGAKWFTLDEIQALQKQGKIRHNWAWRVIQKFEEGQ
jgi:ADP-ribose pyrophosphatase YjhB (NUDIX family)